MERSLVASRSTAFSGVLEVQAARPKGRFQTFFSTFFYYQTFSTAKLFYFFLTKLSIELVRLFFGGMAV